MLPSCLEQKVIEYAHTSLGHLVVDKCMSQIGHSLHMKNLGRNVRKFIACCDLCQRAKHPTQSHTIEEKHHLTTKPGDICAIDLYGGLPTSRSGVKYILVCYAVFSKHVKLYPLKAATTRACINKLINKYFGEVIKPTVIMSDNGNQFRSPSWRRKLTENAVAVRFSPVRHPQNNPSERVMKELSIFYRIYCHQYHKRWADLLPQIEQWLNKTVASSTRYAPVEFISNAQSSNIFAKILPELGDSPENEGLAAKVLKAYTRMKEKASERDSRRKLGNCRWAPRVNSKVLVKTQPISDVIMEETSKFMLLCEGPFLISNIRAEG